MAVVHAQAVVLVAVKVVATQPAQEVASSTAVKVLTRPNRLIYFMGVEYMPMKYLIVESVYVTNKKRRRSVAGRDC